MANKDPDTFLVKPLDYNRGKPLFMLKFFFMLIIVVTPVIIFFDLIGR